MQLIDDRATQDEVHAVRTTRRPGAVVASFVAIGLLLAPLAMSATPAGAGGFAPLDQPGPGLEQSATALAAALRCPVDLATVAVDPVLLVPGTRLSPQVNFGWNWVPALHARGIPTCTVALDDRGHSDIQLSVENVVHAIRRVHEITGRPVRVVGYSQGGVLPRWALRFWPDLRQIVSEVVTLAGVHNGTTSTDALCLVGCAPALFQLRPGTRAIAALNSLTTTYPGVAVTSVYSRYDELATPNLGGEASTLQGATNVALQDVCPANVSEHLTTGTTDPVAFALALDALTHDGPADPERIPQSVCTQTLLPGVDPFLLPFHLLAVTVEVATSLAGEPRVTAEPPLRCYVTASC